MIEWLKGHIIELEPTHLILEVNGVGYGLDIPVSTYEEINNRDGAVELFVETLVRETEIRLFGFTAKKEKEFFNHIRSISGIGPKIAIAMLSTYSVDELVDLIRRQELKALTKVPGIGKKTAERILFELREKFEAEEKFLQTSESITNEFRISNASVVEETILALVALGYRQNEAEKTVSAISSNLQGDEITVEKLLKACLKELK
ncbi:MAG: Holliday junction branch migration protein RuvA [Calditrichia bacterium]